MHLGKLLLNVVTQSFDTCHVLSQNNLWSSWSNIGYPSTLSAICCADNGANGVLCDFRIELSAQCSDIENTVLCLRSWERIYYVNQDSIIRIMIFKGHLYNKSLSSKSTSGFSGQSIFLSFSH